jgi:hypothetical protein
VVSNTLPNTSIHSNAATAAWSQGSPRPFWPKA